MILGLKAAADTVLRTAAERENGVPGVVAMATNQRRNVYEGVAGKRDLSGDQPMTTDTVFSIRSCTKAITGTSVMQLVQEGKIRLDDPAKAYVPEIASVQVLDGFDDDGTPLLRAPSSDITISQLLLHTAGFGYDFLNADLYKYGLAKGARGAGAVTAALPESVLLFDPGSRWEYGTNIDWAGKVTEAVRGERLGDIMRKHIFEPLEMNDTGFLLSPAARLRLATMHERRPDGAVRPRHDMTIPQERPVQLGGTGLYATVGDYMKFIRMILNDGAAPNGHRVLQAQTVATMATNGLGPLKIKPLPGVILSASRDVEFFPGMRKSWGYSWMINDERAPTGRPAGELSWAGLANLYYWIDCSNRIGGFWATQILPFFDEVSMPAYLEFETTVYDHLRELI